MSRNNEDKRKVITSRQSVSCTSLAAACRTLYSGASVDAGRPARTALQ